MLDEGCSVAHIATSLRISRMSVYRLQRAAEEQGRSVPEPKACGGQRKAKLSAVQQAAVVQRALQHPKETLQELKEHCVPPSAAVSRSTMWRALHKAGVRHKKATFFDSKTQTDAGIVYERKAFRTAQQTDPALAADQLIFFDETLVRLNEQQARGWAQGPNPARLPRPKGQGMTTVVFLAIGRGGIFHYRLYPPARPFQPVAPRFQACELKEPGRGIDVGLTAAQIQREATADQLRGILQQQHVKVSDAQGRRLSKADLQATVLQLKRTGRLGLLRATKRGRQDQGGAKRAFRATTRDIVQYWVESFMPWAEEHKVNDLPRRTVVWDNASTHSSVRTTQTQRISVFHRWFREWGLRGAVFTPPRSPAFNPAELVFAYIKRWVRKWAPDAGYTQEELEAAIHRAMAKVTPTMIENWISGCGYKVNPLLLPSAAACEQGFRWAGYGPKPVGVDETEPEVGFVRDDVYAAEAIVDERQRSGHREFRLRWKGYGPESDTWEPESHLIVGATQLLYAWKHQRHH